MNKREKIKKELGSIKNRLTELETELKKLDSEKDYQEILSQFVCKYVNTIALIHPLFLIKSFTNGDIILNNEYKEDYDEPLKYEEVQVKDLQVNDIFWGKYVPFENLKRIHFNIYLGEIDNSKRILYIDNVNNISNETYTSPKNTIVRRIKRDN